MTAPEEDLGTSRAVTVQVRVTHEDVDKMGVARYDNFLRWFQRGREGYVDDLPDAVKEMAAEGYQLPVTESYVRYRDQALHEDRLSVFAMLTSADRDQVRFGYRVERDEDGVLVADGYTVHACAGPSGRRMRFPEKLQGLLRHKQLRLE